MKESRYTVTGMTCASCSAHVQRAASKVPGVTNAEVNLANETLTVQYDESKANFDTFRQAVEQAGYGLIAPQVGKRAELGVDGMTCASCSAAVERALKKLDGVTEASVNLATNRASFVYDPAKVKLAQVREAITKAGYTPLDLESEDTHDVDRERRERALLVMRIRLIVAAVFAAPILYIAMAHMFPALGVPLPSFMNPHSFPLVFALVQLLLTIPVLIAGGKFFRVGMKTLL
jgi:Cu+-exporting ATPase